MRVLPAVVAVALLCVSARAQATVSESGIRAHQVNGVTTITLPVRNPFAQGIQAQIDLAWLAADNKQQASDTRTVVLPPGEAKIEVPLPITGATDSLEERLSYEIRPGYPNLTVFDKIGGMMSLAHNATFAFTVRVASLSRASAWSGMVFTHKRTSKAQPF